MYKNIFTKASFTETLIYVDNQKATMGVDDELLNQKKSDIELPDFDSLPSFEAPPPPRSPPKTPSQPNRLPESNIPKQFSGFPSQLSKQSQEPAPKVGAVNLERASDATAIKGLRGDIQKLTIAVQELLEIFKLAHQDIKEEPANHLSEKLDKLIDQNEEMARSLLLMLELNREHLPNISRHTRVSNELKLRKPRHR